MTAPSARQLSHRYFLVVLIGIGTVSGLVAVVFHEAMALCRHLLLDPALALEGNVFRIVAAVGMPAVGGALITLAVAQWAPRAGGGMGLIRRSYLEDPRRLDFRTWLGTLLATPLSLGTGAPLGPEGPTVVLTSGVATATARYLRLPVRVIRGMLPVGTAAGIAAMFNTPITGVVFALEEVIGTASRGVLGGALVAAVAAAVVQKALLGGRRLLPAAPVGWNDPRELIGFALVGLISGFAAGAIVRVVPRLKRELKARTDAFGWRGVAVRGFVGGLVVGGLGLLSPTIFGAGYDAIAIWLRGFGDFGSAGIAFVAKLIAVVVALATSLVGGVFAPSLFLGAALGSATGHAALLLLPDSGIDPGAYAMVGMGAFFAGFLRTPMAAILIVFELTGDYGLVLPQMLAVAISVYVARRLAHSSLVERQLEEEGVHRSEALRDPLARHRVEEVMTTAVTAIPHDVSMLQAARLAAGSHHPYFPVVDADHCCVGVLTAEAIDDAARAGRIDALVGSFMEEPRVFATPGETLDRLSLRLGQARRTRCPVVESQERRRLIGFIAPGDIFRARAEEGTISKLASMNPDGPE